MAIEKNFRLLFRIFMNAIQTSLCKILGVGYFAEGSCERKLLMKVINVIVFLSKGSHLYLWPQDKGSPANNSGPSYIASSVPGPGPPSSALALN